MALRGAASELSRSAQARRGSEWERDRAAKER
jgi:hypothetical protein